MFENARKFKPMKKTIFTILVGLAAILFWRASWGLLDLYFFPSSPELSYWLSAVLGLIILAITYKWTK